MLKITGLKQWITLANRLLQHKAYQVMPSYWVLVPVRINVLKAGIN
jgi:hypothetical protein